MDMVRVEGGKVYLKTGLSEEQFGKTKFGGFIDGLGLKARVVKTLSGTGTSEGESLFVVTTSEWKFDSPRVIDGEVNFVGESPFGKATALNKVPSDRVEGALCTVIACYIDAIKKGYDLPTSGPEGVLVSEAGDEILFLPSTAVKRSCANCGGDFYKTVIDPWEGGSLWTLAIYIYFLLAKKLPFPNSKVIDKSVNISAKNFIPLSLLNRAIPRALDEWVSSVLSGKAPRIPDNLFSLVVAGLAAIKLDSKDGSQGEDLKLKKARDLYIKRLNKRMNKRRWTARYIGLCTAGAVIIISIITFVAWAAFEQSEKPTAIGLSDRDVTIMFYSGLSMMNTDYLIAAGGSCIEAQPYISRLPQIYIASIMKGTLNMESGISTPVQWLFYTPETDKFFRRVVYGVDNFFIDGEAASLDFQAGKLRNHPKAISYRGKERLGDYSSATHTVQYDLVRTVDDAIITEHFRTDVTLRYEKNRWEVFTLHEESEKTSYSIKEFSKALKDAIDRLDGNVVAACDELRHQYQWIPSQKDVKKEAKRLERIGY